MMQLHKHNGQAAASLPDKLESQLAAGANIPVCGGSPGVQGRRLTRDCACPEEICLHDQAVTQRCSSASPPRPAGDPPSPSPDS